jgi:hypothetical protein
MTLEHSYQGATPYYSDLSVGAHRLVLAVPCFLEEGTAPIHALLDTASEWCVLPSETAEELGFDLTSLPPQATLHTRLGRIAGRLERVRVRFRAVEGEDIEIDATCFVSADWAGPMVIGWKGCLERIRFAIDPGDEVFHFAGL